MHSMTESAPNRREEQRRQTSAGLIRFARELTAERGLAGFTIEELCSEAAISRRTFFNYFASKEDAVLGIPLHRTDAEAIAAFLAAGTGAGTLSPTLLLDLATLVTDRWRAAEVGPEQISALFAAVDKEPRLIGRMLQHGLEEEQFHARLIEQRENLPEGDLRAEIAAQVIGAISRAAITEFLAPGHDDTFPDIFARRIAAARDLFATQTTLIGSAR